MSGVNHFLPFATGVGANVVTQAAYKGLTTLVANGFQAGTATSNQLNKVWRQSSIMSAVLAQFLVDETGADANDDGTTATLLTQLKDSVLTVLERTTVTVGGTANVLTATFTRPPTVFLQGIEYKVRATAANTIAGVTFTPNSGTLAPKTVVKLNGAALVAGDIAGAGHWLSFAYDTTLDKYILLNPATGAGSSAATALAGGGPGQLPYQSAAGVTSFLAAGTAGYLLQSGGTGAPVWVANPSFGVGQTWQSVSRAAGTTYYNTDSKARELAIGVNYTGGYYTTVTMGGVTATIAGAQTPGGVYTSGGTICVPAGSDYTVNINTISGSASIASWTEMKV